MDNKKINILIDTCSWINLLSEDVNELLPHLNFWKDNNCINIITHKVILEEWNKHKQEQKEKISQSLLTKYKYTNEIARKENLLIPQNLEPNIQNIECQIQTIDELLQNSAILDVSDEIKASCADRCHKKKAPFHNKQFSMADAYIIFSALEYFEELGQEFLFVSANTKEFSSSEKEPKIHPEIIEDYPNVKVRYFDDIGRAINVLKEELPMTLLQEKVSSENLNNINDSIEIDKTKHILDQVYDYILLIREELNFYPINLLINHYPFQISKKPYSYYSISTLNTDNQKLLELFNSIEITEDSTINIANTQLFENVDDYLSKIKFVLNALSENLIFNISERNTRNSIRVRFYENTECGCSLCKFEVFKFVDCLNNLNSFSDSKDDLQKSFYLNYLMGNYVTAVEKQKKLLNLFKKEKQNTHCFISQFNLSKLSNFLFWGYFGNDSVEKLEEELKQIDLKREAIFFSKKENGKLINYISEKQFYLNAKDKIQISTNKLRDQYYNSLNGGWSSNSEVWNLISEFGILESFLSSNHIIFNQFSEFNELFGTFTEGLFVSYATNNEGNSRLKEFDDWLIHNLLTYGNSNVINKFYKRYKLKKINYKKTSQGNSFVDLINNFFNNNELREVFANNNSEKGNRHFWEHYDKIFGNILTLVSICNFDNNYIREFTHKLIDFLKKECIPRDLIQQINTFIYRCGKELDRETLQKLFDLAVDNPPLHKLDYFDALFYIIDKKKEKLSIDEETFNKVMTFVFEECTICKEKHSKDIVIKIYLLIDNQEYKNKISNVIVQKLQEQFDFDLFYSATIFDVIPFYKNLFSTAIAFSYPQDSHLTHRSVFFNLKENRYSNVDAMLNLCFKQNIDTNTDDFQLIKKLDKYYEWLVDMDNFDYDCFEPQWISVYATKYYLKKFYDCKLVKEKLNKILKEKSDTQIEKDYINIYVRKTWEKNVCT